MESSKCHQHFITELPDFLLNLQQTPICTFADTASVNTFPTSLAKSKTDADLGDDGVDGDGVVVEGDGQRHRVAHLERWALLRNGDGEGRRVSHLYEGDLPLRHCTPHFSALRGPI